MKTEIILSENWQKFLQEEMSKSYFTDIMEAVDKEYENGLCYPPKSLIFNAFNVTTPQNIKVVIIGQDPYHGQGEANGLSFSVNDGIKIPPSLLNIFKEINLNFDTIFLPKSGNLENWAKQGVLLLNATLTVKKDTANSHKNIGWQQFTAAVIKKISEENEQVVFMLWGNFAMQKAKLIDANKHLILTSGHPSPMSANQRKWFGNKHFLKANSYLQECNKTPIIW